MQSTLVWDEPKRIANLAKHGLALSDAERLEWSAALLWPDQRMDYQEARMVGLVPDGARLFCVVFVDRPADAPTERRVISLRKANNREVQRYASND